jgi:hypothetical protein
VGRFVEPCGMLFLDVYHALGDSVSIKHLLGLVKVVLLILAELQNVLKALV